MTRRPQLGCFAAALALALVATSCTTDAGITDSTSVSTAPTSAIEAGRVPSADYFADSGTDDIDVTSYEIDARVTIEGEDRLDATATLRSTARADLEQFDLDLVGLEVRTVSVDGVSADVEVDERHLTVIPADPIGDGEVFTTVVEYGGNPAGELDPVTVLEDEGGGWLDLGDYSVVIAEPVGAPRWFPSNDTPSDKASFLLDVTVPAPLTAVSNGRMTGSVPVGSSTTYSWGSTEPMATYLATLAIGEFDLRDRARVNGPYVTDAVPPGHEELAERLVRGDEIRDFFADRFGPYPFAIGGGIIVPDMPPTALETQTRPVYSVAALSEDDPAGQLVAHELADQWFGNAVTPESWHDIWLNEGPAVYSQWLWLEHSGGPTVLESARASHDPEDPDLDLPPGDPGTAELFGTSVYERSAVFLVELEQLMGAGAFAELLRAWVDQHLYANATAEQFVSLASEIHGESIESLSNAWLYGDELPPISF